jgi:hypothetical protein
MVAEHRARVRNRKFVCIPYAGEYAKKVVNVHNVLKIRYVDPGENKPYTGSNSFLNSHML